VPVIVSESVGAKDCVREGVDGFVVPVRDVEALADRLLWLCDHSGQRDAMGEKARDRAKAYSWDAYRARLADKIQALSDQHAAPRAMVVAR
jgi:glycosyltransferase involved in cell wall biosynthesis